MKKLLVFALLLVLLGGCQLFQKDAKYVGFDRSEPHIKTIPGNVTNYHIYEIEGITYYVVYVDGIQQIFCPERDRAIIKMSEIF